MSSPKHHQAQSQDDLDHLISASDNDEQLTEQPPPVDLDQSLVDLEWIIQDHKQSPIYRFLNAHLQHPWVVVSDQPIIVCRHKINEGKHVEVDFTIRIDHAMYWKLFLKDTELHPSTCPLLEGLPTCLKDMKSILQIMKKLDETEFCQGNPDSKFIELIKQRATTLNAILSTSFLMPMYIFYQ